MDFCKEYYDNIANLIYENSNKEIPKQVCSTLAKNIINRMQYDISRGVHKDIMEYVEASIWAYSQ